MLTAAGLRQEEIVLEPEIAPDLPLVQAQLVPLEQVLVNLLLNARDAIRLLPPGTPRRIRLRAVRAGEAEVAIEVADSGGGLDAAMLPRLFEPFVTDQADGGGAGARAFGQPRPDARHGRYDHGQEWAGRGGLHRHAALCGGPGSGLKADRSKKPFGGPAREASLLQAPAGGWARPTAECRGLVQRTVCGHHAGRHAFGRHRPPRRAPPDFRG